jgi:pimeloyl-ACP methyl ester carboxylesterase
VLGSGPAVVMCHGTPWSSALWRPAAESLADEYTVYLWDMPGYGASSKDAEHDVSLGVQSELLADLLEVWGLESPHVVAHDYGGVVALRAHLLHGSSYASLALVDVVALSPWGTDFLRLVRDNVEVFDALPPHVHEGVVRAYVAGASRRGLSAEQADLLVAPWLGATGQPALYRQMAAADERFTDEVEPRYPSVAVPTHVVWGEDDAWIPIRQGRRLAEMIPGATFESIPDAGHLVQFDAPERLLAALRRWLSAHR